MRSLIMKYNDARAHNTVTETHILYASNIWYIYNQLNKLNIIKEVIFPDHYKYDIKDIKQIKQEAKQIGAKIITTEKDYVKIPRREKSNINFLKVELKIENEKQFVSFLKSKIYD